MISRLLTRGKAAHVFGDFANSETQLELSDVVVSSMCLFLELLCVLTCDD